METKRVMISMTAALLLAGAAQAEGKASASDERIKDAILASMVSIPEKGCKMSKYEVTQELWGWVMGTAPSAFSGGKNPVENVSWDDCQEFLKKLNAMPAIKSSGLVFRLPTVEEWEHACGAGSTERFSKFADGSELTEASLGDAAWYDANSDGRTHPVGQKKPNAFGLYDMHGNVWEWTQTADGDRRVFCGGCWNRSAPYCEACTRGRGLISSRFNYLGFRLCASSKAE